MLQVTTQDSNVCAPRSGLETEGENLLFRKPPAEPAREEAVAGGGV